MQQKTWIDNDFLLMMLQAMNAQSEPESLRVDEELRLMIRSYGLLIGHNAAGAETEVLLEDDGTIREQLIAWEYTGGTQIRVAAEQTTGQLQNVPMGWNGAALSRFLLETNGEQRVSNYGQDEALNMDAFRTDPNRILWRRDFPGWIDAAPAELPAAEADLFSPALGAAVRLEVDFQVVNDDAGFAAIANCYVGRGVVGAAIARPNWWMFNETIPGPGTSGWRTGFRMNGNDTIRGNAAVANDAAVHFRVRRIDVGA